MKQIIPFFLFVFFSSGVFAEVGTLTVTVLSSEAGTGLTEIEYEFTGDEGLYNISAEVSFDNGNSFYPVPDADLEGALTNIAPGGPYSLTWDGRVSFPETFSDETIVRITANLTWQCGDDITFTYRGSEVTYGTILVDYGGAVGEKCWMDRNLGASQVAQSSTDELAYGDLFQWGRLDDGHQDRNSLITLFLSTTNVPGNSFFISVSGDPLDWRSPQNDALWQGKDGINDPCPPGWSVPTSEELDAERLSWSTNTSAGAFASDLRWPVGGNRNDAGLPTLVGSQGNVWSSSVLGDGAFFLFFDIDDAGIGSGARVGGMSVRCIVDTADEPTTYNLQLDINPENAGTVSGAGDYREGEDVGITATPEEGWEFVNWTGDTQHLDDADSAEAMLTMPAVDLALTAVFQEEDEDPGFVCDDNITFTYRGQEVTYGIVLRGGLCWMDRNLGASRVPNEMDDEEGYGDLFQWGRGDDGHQDRLSSTTPGPVDQDVPGHGEFITVESSPYDWRDGQNNNLWQGGENDNNPCPPGWRLPTQEELNTERLSWFPSTSTGAFASDLRWPVGGTRINDGTLVDLGTNGRVWGSSVDGVNSRFLSFQDNGTAVTSFYRVLGMSVRCVSEP